MRQLLFPQLTAFLLLLPFGAPARAEVIYNNGGPDRAHGSEMTQFIEADDFELTHATRLDQVTFWSAERANSFAGSFTWEIFANSDDDSPGRLILSGTSANLSRGATGAAASGGYPEYVNTFDLGSVALPAGTYWVALHNGPLTNSTPALSVFWETTSNIGERASHGAISPLYQSWFSNEWPTLPSELAFFTNGVPLPRITSLDFSSGIARISFTSTAGEHYRVEYTNSLTAPSWATLPGADTLPGTGGIVQFNDPQANVRSLARRFYRVVLL